MEDVAAAKQAVASISAAELKDLMGSDGVLIVDVRDAPELSRTGCVPGAINVSRGMIEFRADDSMPTHDPAFSRDKTVVVYCASGARAALAGKALMELGYVDVRTLGTLKAWTDAGGEVERG
jgi:rhodanese-related sulfurtransferase